MSEPELVYEPRGRKANGERTTTECVRTAVLGYQTPEEYAATVAARPASPPHAGRISHAEVGQNGCARTPEC